MRPINYDLYTTYTQHTVLLYEAFIVEIDVQFSVLSLPVFQKKNYSDHVKVVEFISKCNMESLTVFLFSFRILLASPLATVFFFSMCSGLIIAIETVMNVGTFMSDARNKNETMKIEKTEDAFDWSE